MASEYVLITGGTGDIGRCFVSRVLQATEYELLVTTTSSENPVTCASSRINVIEMDASSPQSMAAAIDELVDYPISYFVQLHGHSKVNDHLRKQTTESLLYHFNVNVFSSVLILSKILTGMEERQFGRVVLMNTASSEHGGGIASFGYGMAKHSVGYLTKHIAKYYAKYNILANCISPGLIDTKFHADVMRRTPVEVKERSKTVRLGRAGTVDEVARLIYFLAFDNSFITGQNIRIDGGDFI